jgi:pilus assembly protein CpaB
MQNIEVLSAGQNIQKDAEGKPISVPVITMLVTPQQAEILSLANQDTRIQLVLRNPLDTQEVKTPGTALAHLFTGQKFGLPDAQRAAARPKPVVKAPEAAAAPKEKPAFVMEVIQGGSRTQAKFQEQPED